MKRIPMLEPTADLAEGIQRFLNHLLIALAVIAALVSLTVFR